MLARNYHLWFFYCCLINTKHFHPPKLTLLFAQNLLGFIFFTFLNWHLVFHAITEVTFSFLCPLYFIFLCMLITRIPCFHFHLLLITTISISLRYVAHCTILIIIYIFVIFPEFKIIAPIVYFVILKFIFSISLIICFLSW